MDEECLSNGSPLGKPRGFRAQRRRLEVGERLRRLWAAAKRMTSALKTFMAGAAVGPGIDVPTPGN